MEAQVIVTLVAPTCAEGPAEIAHTVGVDVKVKLLVDVNVSVGVKVDDDVNVIVKVGVKVGVPVSVSVDEGVKEGVKEVVLVGVKANVVKLKTSLWAVTTPFWFKVATK